MTDAQAAQLLVLLGVYAETYFPNTVCDMTLRELVDDLAETVPDGDVHRVSARGKIVQEGAVVKEEVAQAIYQNRIWR